MPGFLHQTRDDGGRKARSIALITSVGGIDTVEVTQRFNAQCGVFNASLLSQTSSSNVVSLKLLCLRLSLITIYND